MCEFCNYPLTPLSKHDLQEEIKYWKEVIESANLRIREAEQYILKYSKELKELEDGH